MEGTRPRPNTVAINFLRPWSVVTPSVFRYENERWIDSFFHDGSLRLSSFETFSKYEDEIRGDMHEGKAVAISTNPEGNTTVLALGQGFSAAVFCCSHRLDKSLAKAFSRDSAFEIFNTNAFALEVSRQLIGFRGGVEGNCIYRPTREINRNINADMSDYELQGGGIDMAFLNEAIRKMGGEEVVLLKKLSYRNQAEYRLLWELDQPIEGFVDIKVPLARQYCRRVDPSEWN